MPQLLPKMENLCCDWSSDRYKDRVKAAARFCAERHRVYIRRQEGQAKPWTKDPILRSYRFCNIYREIDRVTEEIMAEWVKPQLKNENIAIVALVGRLINFTSTLTAMRDAGITFERGHGGKIAWPLFKKIIAGDGKKRQQLVTGAYIVNTVFPKDHQKIDGTKADYIANFFLPEAWSHRADLLAALKTNSFKAMLDAYRQVHGVGMFIANQAAVDLTYTKHLRTADDINDVWSPGPGTMKGIRRITSNYELNAGREETDKALTKYRDDLNYELSMSTIWSEDISKVKTNIVPLSAPNASNSLCELSKHFGMATGERDRMKNTYKGG